MDGIGRTLGQSGIRQSISSSTRWLSLQSGSFYNHLKLHIEILKMLLRTWIARHYLAKVNCFCMSSSFGMRTEIGEITSISCRESFSPWLVTISMKPSLEPHCLPACRRLFRTPRWRLRKEEKALFSRVGQKLKVDYELAFADCQDLQQLRKMMQKCRAAINITHEVVIGFEGILQCSVESNGAKIDWSSLRSYKSSLRNHQQGIQDLLESSAGISQIVGSSTSVSGSFSGEMLTILLPLAFSNFGV